MTLSALILLTASIALVCALTVLHVAPTGLSPLGDPVSAYALTAYRRWYTVAALAAAVAGIAAALLLVTAAPGGIAPVLLGVFAVARLVIPFFPMDAPTTRRTPAGRLHNVLAIIAFASVTVAAFLAAGPLHDAGHASAATVTTVAAVVMAIGSVVVILSRPLPRLRRVFGLAERLIYLGFSVWFIVLAVTALG